MNVVSLPVPDLASQGLDIPYPGDKVLLDYVYVTYNRLDFQHKTKVVDKEPLSITEIDGWYNNATATAEYTRPAPELYLQPVAMFRDPFRKGKNKIVFCELLHPDRKPIVPNTRAVLREVTGRPEISADEPWCGWEQEFFITDVDGLPLGWDMNPTFVENCRHCAVNVGNNVGFERSLVEYHLKACLYAELNIYGINREECCAQWEYQTGPGDCLEMADHLVISRYLLMRCAEIYGVHVSFKPKVAPRSGWSSGCHMNFSTNKMRQDCGMKYIEEATKKLSLTPQDKMLPSYDRNNGMDNIHRLTGAYYAPSSEKFVIGMADKTSNVRIPPKVIEDGKGYFEERRPSSDCDPYSVMVTFLEALYTDKFIS